MSVATRRVARIPTPALPVDEAELWVPSPDQGECRDCGLRAVYVRKHKTWVHDASVARVLVVAQSLELKPSHRVRPIVDGDASTQGGTPLFSVELAPARGLSKPGQGENRFGVGT